MFKAPLFNSTVNGSTLWPDRLQMPAPTRIEVVSKSPLTESQYQQVLDNAQGALTVSAGALKSAYLAQRQSNDISGLGVINTMRPIDDNIALRYSSNNGLEYLSIVVKAEAFMQPPKKPEPKTLEINFAYGSVDIAWFVDEIGYLSGDLAFLENLWGVWWVKLTAALKSDSFVAVRHGLFGLNAFPLEVSPKYSGFAPLGATKDTVPFAGLFNQAWAGGYYGQALDALYDAFSPAYDIGWDKQSVKIAVVLTNNDVTPPTGESPYRTKNDVETLVKARNGFVVYANYTSDAVTSNSYLVNPGVSVTVDYAQILEPSTYLKLSQPILAAARAQRLALAPQQKMVIPIG